MSRASHRVWAEIDLDALRHNLGVVRRRLDPGTQVLAVDEPGLWGFGVGDSQEALELRVAGIVAPILILGTIIPEEVPQVVSHDVRVCIHSMDRIESLAAESARQGRRTRVHLMVDTGMGRLGALPPRAAELARAVAASAWLELEGVCTHVSASRPGHPFTGVQHERLAALLTELDAEGIAPALVHFSNTSSIASGIGTALPLVRPGISLYGVVPGDIGPLSAELQPVMSLRTQVVYLKDVPAGTPIGYNGTWVSAEPTRIATLPIGYNDGLAYRLSNRGRALVRGRMAPIVGSISMDYTMLDVGDVPGVSVGDTVTLIGGDGEQSIGMGELASLVGTIPYEIACSVGKRVRRLYARDEARDDGRDELGHAPRPGFVVGADLPAREGDGVADPGVPGDDDAATGGGAA